MIKLRIAVLMGGTSPEREVSLSSGRQVARALEQGGRYVVKVYDPKTDLGKLFDNRKKIDLALIIMHGVGGEDGTIQGYLELLGIPYTGSGVLASALGMDKVRSLALFTQAGIRVPQHRVWRKRDSNKELFGLQFPVVVKPNRHGSSIGIAIVADKNDLKKAVDEAYKYDDEIIIQDYIDGTELTVGILGNEQLEVLPVVEIVPTAGRFYDYDAKYNEGGSKHFIPARVNPEIITQASEWAKIAHKILGCRGFSRTDFIYGTAANRVSNDLASKAKQLFVLETNTIPGLTPTSLLPDAAAAAGYEFTDLIERIIHLAVK